MFIISVNKRLVKSFCVLSVNCLFCIKPIVKRQKYMFKLYLAQGWARRIDCFIGNGIEAEIYQP